MCKKSKQLKSVFTCMILSLAIVFSTSFTGIGTTAWAATAAAASDSPVTSKDVVYQIITDRFYDGDPSNNVPSGFDRSLFDGTGQQYRLYRQNSLPESDGHYCGMDFRPVRKQGYGN